MKKNSKRAFTLVELLAVIIVLAVVITIAVPSVRNSINKSYQEAYKLDLTALVKGAEDYVLKKSVRIENATQTKITALQMIDEGIINKVVDPNTNEACDGYVIVLNDNGNYIYTPYLKCGENYTSDGYNNYDTVPPVITILGSNPISVNVGSTYVDEGATAVDNFEGNMTEKMVVTSNINVNMAGTYYVTYSATDSSSNTTTLKRTVNVIDNIAPTVAFGTNGNSTYAKTRSTTVTVSDPNSGVNTSSLKYLWNTSTTTPTEASITTSFTNGGTINSPVVTGGYYLWILAKDLSGNTIITRSNVFNLDNTKPVITITGTNPISIAKGSTYTDAGATSSDAHSGLNGSVTATSTVNTSTVGTYTVTYNVSDNAGNAATAVVRTVNVIDVSAPVITILGSNPININYGSTYTDAGATALDDVNGNVTSSITVSSNVNPNAVGTYTVTYTVKDSSNNTATATRTVYVIDNIAPTISFEINGSSTYVKSSGTKVYVTDNVSVDASSLKFAWNMSSTAPAESTLINSFTSGGTLGTPAGISGGFYVWTLAKDMAGNKTMTRSNVFNLDNTKPVITITGSNPVSINAGSTYTDAGATASDAHSGINGSVSVSSNVNPNVPGTYTVTYNVSDMVGNAATAVTRTVNVNVSEFNYAYTGAQQTFTAPLTGTYKLEVWGAQGGGAQGGKGGYSVGTKTLNAGDKLYIEVGGMGSYSTTYNITLPGGYGGGGSARNDDYGGSMGTASGGGGTTIYSHLEEKTILAVNESFISDLVLENKQYTFMIYGYYGLSNATKAKIGNSSPYSEISYFPYQSDSYIQFQFNSNIVSSTAYLFFDYSGSFRLYKVVMRPSVPEPRLIVAGGGGGQGVSYIGSGYSRTLVGIVAGGAGGGTDGYGAGAGGQGFLSSSYLGGRSSYYPVNGGRGFGGLGENGNCGGGGGGYVGGTGGMNIGSGSDFVAYYGAGGSGYIGGVTNGSTTNDVRTGNGYAKITYLP